MMSKPILPLLLTTLLSFLLFFASPVQAGGCVLGICGKIHNQSSWTLLYTTNPRPDNKCTSCCYFWNWSGNKGQQTTCTQLSLGPGGSAGGSGVDVDGYTYANRDYYHNGRKIIKGQWSKFSTYQTVRCKDDNGVPRCST